MAFKHSRGSQIQSTSQIAVFYFVFIAFVCMRVVFPWDGVFLHKSDGPRTYYWANSDLELTTILLFVSRSSGVTGMRFYSKSFRRQSGQAYSTYADISNSREEGLGKTRPCKTCHFSAFSRLQLEGMKMYTFFKSEKVRKLVINKEIIK